MVIQSASHKLLGFCSPFCLSIASIAPDSEIPSGAGSGFMAPWFLSWHTGSSLWTPNSLGTSSVHRKIAGKWLVNGNSSYSSSQKMVKNRFDPPFLAMMENDDDFRSKIGFFCTLYGGLYDVRIPMDGIVLFSTCKNPLTRIVNIPSGGPKKKKSVAGSRVSAFLH
jgi:hypothetical protein